MKRYVDQEYFKRRQNEDYISRRAIESTVKEILTIATKETGKNAKDLVVLDIGSGFGFYSLELGRHVKRVVGIEPFKEAFDIAQKKRKETKYGKRVEFFNKLIEDFNTFEQFDLAISLTTIEHMPNANASFRKVFSLLKKGGILYLTAPNKWWPIEPHYNLPFLSWLPLPLANFYMKLLNAGKSYEDSSYSRSYFGMKKLFSQYNCSYKFVVPDPKAEYLGCNTGKGAYKIMRSTGIWLIKRFPILWSISKGFIMVIKKN